MYTHHHHPGGALLVSVGGVLRATVLSSFSQPGPRFNQFLPNVSVGSPAPWAVETDASKAEREGRWVVRAAARDGAYSVTRVVQLEPFPAARRVLVNDTITAGDTELGMLFGHTVQLPGAQRVESAIAAGSYFPMQCGSDTNFEDLCAAPCLDKGVRSTNNGPSSTTTILGCFQAPSQTQMIHCEC